MNSIKKAIEMLPMIRTLMLVVAVFLGASGTAYADGKIVQVALEGPDYTHVVNAVSIDLSEDETTVTIEIRDPNADPDTTSTLIIEVATGTVTSHTGSEEDYTDWTVLSVWEISEGGEKSGKATGRTT